MVTSVSCNSKVHTLILDQIQDLHGRIIANQTFFINEIYELKRDIPPLKEKVSYGDHSNSDAINKSRTVQSLKLQAFFIKQEKSLS